MRWIARRRGSGAHSNAGSHSTDGWSSVDRADKSRAQPEPIVTCGQNSASRVRACRAIGMSGAAEGDGASGTGSVDRASSVAAIERPSAPGACPPSRTTPSGVASVCAHASDRAGRGRGIGAYPLVGTQAPKPWTDPRYVDRSDTRQVRTALMRARASAGVSIVLDGRLVIGGSDRGQRVTHQGAGTFQEVCLPVHQPGELAGVR
jgi:hypothetical protein